MWWKLFLFMTVLLALLLAAVFRLRADQWKALRGEWHAELEAVRVPIVPICYDLRELEGLPDPVRRYFRTVVKEGQPLVAAARVEHTGFYNVSDTGAQWKPFHSTRRIITQHPGFICDARLETRPGITEQSIEAYAAGKGCMAVKHFGHMGLVEHPSTPELTHTGLMRFLAEGVWYPTALLPSQGVIWEGIDQIRARARLTDCAANAAIVFQFNRQGVIESVHASGRFCDAQGGQAAIPWQSRFWEYQWRDNMLIPLAGEAAWLRQEGSRPYWRGRVQSAEYEYARQG